MGQTHPIKIVNMYLSVAGVDIRSYKNSFFQSNFLPHVLQFFMTGSTTVLVLSEAKNDYNFWRWGEV